MAGFYVHIPFCRDACTYCDFHFSVSVGHLKPMLQAIAREIHLRRNFLEGEMIRTVYFGGGTPSIMNSGEIENILHKIYRDFLVDPEAEISLEANPEDLNPDYLLSLGKIGINRLSIGIQSFDDDFLTLMNRRHDSKQAKDCLIHARKAGFENLNLDLIYGLPGMSNKKWRETLLEALSFHPAHLSAYHLSYEPGSVLDYRRRKGKVIPVKEARSLEHFGTLVDLMETHGYEHYEISNFALPGYTSKHNSAYWKGVHYLGVGPSAHSYDGGTRRWNPPRNSSYIRGIMDGEEIGEQEILDENIRFREYIMTSLRTAWGIDTEYIREEWGEDLHRRVLQRAKPFIDGKKIREEGKKLVLTREGMFICDHIVGKLFL